VVRDFIVFGSCVWITGENNGGVKFTGKVLK